MNRNVVRFTIGTVTGMLIASALACGGGSTSAPPAEEQLPPAPTGETSGGAAASGDVTGLDPSNFTACDALQQIDATTFFQTQANPGVANSGSNSTSCMYTSTVQGDQLFINLLYEDGNAQDSSDFTSVRTSDTVPVAGLGDDAYYNNAFYQITVAKGRWMFTINGSLRGTNVDQGYLVQLANLVLLRMQSESN